MSTKLAYIAISLTLTIAPITMAQTTWYVDDDAPGDNTGLNWYDAFTDLQSALDASTNGDRIHLAGGTYHPSRRYDATRPRTETFLLVDQVGLYGGYAGHGAPNPDSRDLANNQSILSGDLLMDDGPNFTNYNDNAAHVVTTAIYETTNILDGLTITAGNANGAGGYFGGAGLMAYWGNPAVVDCTFVGNYANSGGAVFIKTGSIMRCSFLNNRAQDGGALRINDSSGVTLIDCSFNNNHAWIDGGAVWGWGGVGTFTGCTFVNNTADGDGGAVKISDSASSFVDCLFTENTAMGGGAISNEGSLTVANSRFIGNNADTAGAISGTWGGQTTLINCEFVGNTAADVGAISCGANSHICNCVLAYNSARNSVGAACCTNDPMQPFPQRALVMANSIVWGNSDSSGSSFSSQFNLGAYISDQTRIDYSCIENWSATVPGIGNIDQDPRFIDPNGLDDLLGTLDDNVRLGSGSPCIDAGSNGVDTSPDDGHQPLPPTDLDGLPRFVDDPIVPDTGIGTPPIVDMGPYEYQQDCNSNGILDSADLAFGTSTDCNGNNVPDSCDLADASSRDCNNSGIPDECELWCDLDNDGHVDDDDYRIIQAALGHQSDHPDYCPCCDPDNDGLVSLIDYQTWLDCYRAHVATIPTPEDQTPSNLAIDYFTDCLSGPIGEPSPTTTTQDHCLQTYDFDSNGRIDLKDFAQLQQAIDLSS